MSPPPNEPAVNQNKIFKMNLVGGGGVERGQDTSSTALQKENEKLPVQSTFITPETSLEPFLGKLETVTDRRGYLENNFIEKPKREKECYFDKCKARD